MHSGRCRKASVRCSATGKFSNPLPLEAGVNYTKGCACVQAAASFCRQIVRRCSHYSGCYERLNGLPRFGQPEQLQWFVQQRYHERQLLEQFSQQCYERSQSELQQQLGLSAEQQQSFQRLPRALCEFGPVVVPPAFTAGGQETPRRVPLSKVHHRSNPKHHDATPSFIFF